MNKSIVKKILYIGTIVGLCNAGLCNASEGIKANFTINRTKNLKATNEDYLRSGSKNIEGKHIEKMYEPAKFSPSFIVLHYAVTTTMGQTINAYYGGGVSAHFTIDKDGVIYEHIDDGNIAYHAGASFWRGKYSLNWYSIAVQQVNTGHDVNRKEHPWKEPRSPAKAADGKEWETWPEVQVESAAKLVKFLAEKYDIKPWNIIGNSDCSCGRKVDPGLYFPWKKLHDDHGVGFWPDEDETITKELANEFKHDDYINLLHAFGYPVYGFSTTSVENADELKEIWGDAKLADKIMAQMKKTSNNLADKETISAFQYHFLQDKFMSDPNYRSGDLDDDTQLMILRCIKSIIKNVDKGDYSLRKIEEMYNSESGFSSAAKKLIESFNEGKKLDLKEQHSEL
jgi:N-acetyl-anhydromuramyl-L-alanine amidase AmpD